MEPNVIDWPKLKTNYTQWWSVLWSETHSLLASLDKLELAQHNEVGYFHRVREQEHFEQMRREWREFRRVLQEWIAKGDFPGIWTALFDPRNTFSLDGTVRFPIFIVRLYFKKGYFLFNPHNPSHRDTLSSWSDQGKENPWQELKNSKEQTLERKLKLHRLPSHKKFFEENDFGAILVESDYLSCVVFLEDSVERVEFFEIH